MDADRRTRMEAAGQWLRRARERRKMAVGELARALGVDPSVISRYEHGVSAVSDDRAEQIADVLRVDILDVRRGLQLWTPPSDEPAEDDEPDLEAMTDEQLTDYIDAISESLAVGLVERHRRKAG